MKKYEVGFGFLNGEASVIEISEIFNNFEDANKYFESEKKDINENSIYKYISLDELEYENNEIININHMKEFFYED